MKYYDLISFFQSEQDTMQEKLNELEAVSKEAEAKSNNENFGKIIKLFNELKISFIKYYTIQEDILFPELEKVLPSPTSTNSMRSEHYNILQLFATISILLDKKDDFEKNKSIFFPTLLTFSDQLQRHFHKKNNVMYHEVSAFFTEKKQNDIYTKLIANL